MKMKFRLLLAGRSKETLSDLEWLLSSLDRVDIQARHIVNGHADPLYGLDEVPDILLLHIQGIEGGELEALFERPASQRPPMVIVSESDDPAAMRLAMKAGARDFLPLSRVEDMRESIDAICDELCEQTSSDGELVAVVNAKGGAGATFLACNLAHQAVCETGESTALVGLDMQFPTLPSYFDMRLQHGLVQAIESVEELDAVALDAIMAKHESGLKVLAARPEDFRFTFDSLVEKADGLFELLQSHYKHVIVDVPRQLDELSARVISRASRIVLVVQQSLPHVQDATRLQQLLRDQLGISADRLVVVVNRYNKSGEIQLEDIGKALPGCDIVTIPNHFKAVSESINLGIPMYSHARQSAVTRALIALQAKTIGRAQDDLAMPAARKISSLLQKTSLQQLFGGK